MSAARGTVGQWIDGGPVAGSGRTMPLFDPSRGLEIGEVRLGDNATVESAVAAAAAAFEEWAETPLGTRVRYLRRWHELVTANRAELVELLGIEQGKVRADAEGELTRALETLDVACAAPLVSKGEFSPQVSRDLDVTSMRLPLGVCAAITPFNFPVMAPVYLSSIALACGNTYIVKPSERAPSAPVRLAELAREAGLPDGVLNVVQGDAQVVDRILTHPTIRAVSFIGSSPVAKHVYATGTASGKRVQAFGGAKNHLVVLPDAGLTEAADAAVSAGFGSAGQRCMAVSVVVAVGDCADDVVKLIAERVERLRVGPADANDTEMGPLISSEARVRVREAIDGAERAGADVVVDGRGYAHPGDPGGYFVGPTLIDRVLPSHQVYRDEVFGPVLCVVRARELAEALALIEDSPFGNGASIFTSDGAAARVFQHRADAGMVGVNVPIPIPNAVYSFGGWNDSRFGDQHMAGTEGFRFYTQQKVLTTRWPREFGGEGVQLAFPGR